MVGYPYYSDINCLVARSVSSITDIQTGNSRCIHTTGILCITDLVRAPRRRGIGCSYFGPLILLDIVEKQIIVHVHLDKIKMNILIFYLFSTKPVHVFIYV